VLPDRADASEAATRQAAASYLLAQSVGVGERRAVPAGPLLELGALLGHENAAHKQAYRHSSGKAD
jgi:hypothetical protein